ncbi:hypothetical protein KSF73_12265 [Burkholderiaceae bacterium DAT-1]|nr:hypothetical protein [Burkholderiaceae bacterium DAT-1]
MDRPHILIISNSMDLHADLVEIRLNALGAPTFRINLDCYPRDYRLNHAWMQHDMLRTIRHLPSGHMINLDDVGAVWLRKSGEFAFTSDDLGAQEIAYARQEAEHALFGLLYTLDCYWMSHPLALRGAMWKGEQLQRAVRFGFLIPDTLVSNHPEAVVQFRSAIRGDMVFKALSSPHLGAESVPEDVQVNTGIGTTVVDDDMMTHIDAVAELPCHFQAYIPKAYELRVTVIGQHVFAAKILSQQDERTRIDCRDMHAEIPYEAYILPPALEQRCRDFVHSYKLQYGAIDLIVTPDGECVFLENNPVGQFLYIEELIPQFRMIDTLAHTLMDASTCTQTI